MVGLLLQDPPVLKVQCFPYYENLHRLLSVLYQFLFGQVYCFRFYLHRILNKWLAFRTPFEVFFEHQFVALVT